MRTLLPALVFTWSVLFAQGSLSAAEFPEDLTNKWDSLLAKHVKTNGGVDYQGFVADKAELTGFIESHAAIDPSAWNDAAKTALYINLYNASMIFNILRYAEAEKIALTDKKFTSLEINSIKVSGGNIWNGSLKVKLAGQDVNLDNIEHDLIRGNAGNSLKNLMVSTLDPRIHAAVNCAAKSCPRVREKAYRPSNIDIMLTENMNEYLSSEDQFSKLSDSKLKANSIVFWYYSDFDNHGRKLDKKGGAGTWIAQFMRPETKDRAWKEKHLQEQFNDRSKVSLKFSSAFDFTYDWQINDIRNK
jgi:hypothetical protein